MTINNLAVKNGAVPWAIVTKQPRAALKTAYFNKFPHRLDFRVK